MTTITELTDIGKENGWRHNPELTDELVRLISDKYGINDTAAAALLMAVGDTIAANAD